MTLTRDSSALWSATVRVGAVACLLALTGLVAGCIVEPREGYYDRPHVRYYHEHNWHECAEHDEHCR